MFFVVLLHVLFKMNWGCFHPYFGVAKVSEGYTVECSLLSVTPDLSAAYHEFYCWRPDSSHHPHRPQEEEVKMAAAQAWVTWTYTLITSGQSVFKASSEKQVWIINELFDL